MNKAKLIKAIVEDVEMSKKDAEKVLNATLEVIQSTLSDGEAVKIQGFGNFEVRDRAPRKGRNPQTGEEIEIAASKAVGFKPAKALKDAVKG